VGVFQSSDAAGVASQLVMVREGGPSTRFLSWSTQRDSNKLVDPPPSRRMTKDRDIKRARGVLAHRATFRLTLGSYETIFGLN
jgi:hypothetical protein